MSETVTNETRVMAATSALSCFCAAKRDRLVQTVTEETIIDLLADLRHLCDRHELSFADLDRMAYKHYLEEK